MATEDFKAGLMPMLDAGFFLTEAQEQEQRSADMSRAYRVNLNILALVALFTGAFLVFSTQALSVIRRRSQFALLRVVGLTRRALLTQILTEGALLGALGSLLGLLLAYVIAATVLHFFGGDLGPVILLVCGRHCTWRPVRRCCFSATKSKFCDMYTVRCIHSLQLSLIYFQNVRQYNVYGFPETRKQTTRLPNTKLL